MKLYLSSYKFGDNPDQLTNLFSGGKKIGLISNALDFSKDVERLEKSQNEQLGGLRDLGLEPEVVDLREYFGKQEELEARINKLDGLWVRGGNTFILRVAYSKSGLDNILKKYSTTRSDFVYSGFSAGVCVIQPTLKGIHLMDNPEQVKEAYGQDTEIIWEGLNILNYSCVPHFESDHSESNDANKAVAYYQDNELPFRTLRDGEVIIETTR